MAYNSQLTSLSYPSWDLIPKESVNVNVTLVNTSRDEMRYSTWFKESQMVNPADSYSLRYYHLLCPLNAIARQYGPAYIYLPENISNTSITPANLSFQFAAPETPGRYTFQYQMVYRHGYWSGVPGVVNWTDSYFGAIIQFDIVVLGYPASQIVSISMPDEMEIAARGTAFITYRNTSLWTWDYNYRIEVNNVDAGQFSKSWFYIPVDKVIRPGESYTFQIPMRAPAITGTYYLQYRIYWNRYGAFGDIAYKTITVTKPMAEIKNLDDYLWKTLSARRSTADIAWQYDIQIEGTDIPPTFGRLIHEESGRCALMGEPVDYKIDYDYPDVVSTVTAYSYGYFLSNRAPWYVRQSRAGADIRAWQMGQSNIGAIQGRLDEITTYENPSHYIARMLFYVDDNTGAIDTTRPGSYGLWAGNIQPVPNWNIDSSDSRFDSRHPTTEEPAKIDGKQFAYDGDKIIDILDDVSEHCHMIYFTRQVKVNGEWREYFYWIPKFGVALGWLGIDQTPTTITPQSAGLLGSPGLSGSIVMEQSYNSVWVEACRKKDSAWFYSYLAGTAVLAGLEIPRTLYYRSYDLLPDPSGNNWYGGLSQNDYFGPNGKNYGNPTENANAQALADAKANQLLTLLEYQIPTFEATFQDLSFELYQVLIFSGFGGLENFNSVEMQVIDINYEYTNPGDGGHTVTITCAPKAQLQASGKFQSVIDEIQQNYEQLKIDVQNNSVDDKLSIILSTYDEGAMCNAQLRSTGNLIKTRTYGYRTAQG